MRTFDIHAIKYYYVLIICNLFIIQGHRSEYVFNSDVVDKIVSDAFKCHAHANPGMAVSVVKDGKVLFAKGYGVTDLERNNEVDNTTLFNVASLSKNMAAALFVKLLDERTNLTVNSKVHELLGSKFRFIDKFRTQEMTFADVMGHRTGVPPNNIIRFDRNLTREGVLERLAHLPTPDQFRVKYYYNNIMYGLITYLTEVLGGDKWENLIRQHIFEPLGMTKSTFVTEVNYTRSDVAWPYVMHDGKLHVTPFEHSRRWGLLAGSVALVSTAKDMTKWMHFHLSGGMNMQGKQVMKPEVLSQIYIPRMTLPTPTSQSFSKPGVPQTISRNTYAFGLRRGFYRGFTRFSHSGSNHGFRALMSTEGVGVFMALTGRDAHYQYRQPLHIYLMDALLGFEPWLNASTICSYPSPWLKPKIDVPTTPTANTATQLLLAVEEYQGDYHNPAYGYLHISYESPTLQMIYGWASWDLYPRRTGKKSSQELFYAKGTNLTIAYNLDPFEFVVDRDNQITEIKATGFEVNAPPIFTKVVPQKKKQTILKNGGNNSSDINFFVSFFCINILITIFLI